MAQSPHPAQQAEPGPESPVQGGSVPALSLEALVVAHHAAVYRYAFRLTGNAVDAEDLTQQTFLVAQQKLHQLRDAHCAGGWLFAIARTSYLKSLAKPFPVSCDSDLAEVPTTSREILDVDSQELQNALEELPAEMRVTIVMFYFEDLSYQQIADEQGVAIGTVMSRLSRAKERLRERLGTETPDLLVPCPPSTPSAHYPVASRPFHSTR